MIFISLLYSFIQSITEYLPISSSAHLILISNYIKINDENLKTILFITTQFATTFATIFYFRKKIFYTAINFYKDKNSLNLILNLFIAFIPTIIFGFFFYSFIKKYLYTNLVISCTLIIGGIIILLIENLNKKPIYNNIDEINKKISFKIGISQIFALIPGMSRSASTIISALFFNLSRKTAIEFSFLLSIPTAFASLTYDIYKNYNIFLKSYITIIFFTFIFTFLFSISIIKLLFNYIMNNTFKIFAIYRIILGLIILLFFL